MAVDRLRRLIPWKDTYVSFEAWFAGAQGTLTEEVRYTNGAIGTFDGYDEVTEYLLIFNPR